MDKRGSRILVSAALALAGVSGVRHGLRRWLQRPLPPNYARVFLESLHGPVEIIRDKWGIPHIYAQNEHDLFFAQGFVHAQDRLFQMDVNRRLGLGQLSEIIGTSGLASDRFARFFGWSRVAEAQIAGADAVTLEVVAAYTAGVNAFIEQGKLPIEFSVLAYKPKPWQPRDISAWGAVLAWGLSVNWETELIRSQLLEKLGLEKAAQMSPNYTDSYETILRDAQVGTHLAAALLDAYHDVMAHLPLGPAPIGQGIGSNNWVIGGQKTKSGRPILANDPHLPPIFPTIWYANHLVGGDYNVTGYGIPGVPGVIIGHNEHVSWGVTNAFPDVQDVYIERFHPQNPCLYEVDGDWFEAEVVTETIQVRGRKPVVETVRYTRNGPVISDYLPEEVGHLSIRWASYARNNHLGAVLAMNRAHNWQTFREGLRHWGFPSQNIVYADVEGNIGYMLPGLIPKRRRGNGLVPSPGWDSRYDWAGWIPFEELPCRFNPPDGVIATANNLQVGDNYPHLLTGEWLPPYRAMRILQLIEAAKPVTLEDNGRFQQDTHSLIAQRFMQAALPILTTQSHATSQETWAIELLCQWDSDMHPDQIAPTLFFGTLVHFTHAVITQAVGEDLAMALMGKGRGEGYPSLPFHEISPELALNWLETGAPEWVGSVKPLLLPALKKTLDVLTDRFGREPEGWRWGDLHKIELHHHLTHLPGVGRLWKPLEMRIGGDGYTVNQTDVSPHFPPDPVNIIASCRLIMDVGEWDNSLASLPGGQSGHPASPHYQDGVEDWLNGRYHPLLFSRERIEAAAEGWILLVDKRGG